MAQLSLWILLSFAVMTVTNSIAIRGPQGGVNTFTGERPVRQEFSVFKDSGAAFDLYIQSLNLFMRQNQSSLLSYYRISGIHGHPYRAWDGVDGSYERGYCTHASILFPSWHRPYLALFEQIIWKNAQHIARKYPFSQRRRYEEAARTLRIPYWDWAISPTMPDLTNKPSLIINLPRGPCNVSNPLYDYAFHPQPPAADFPPQDRLAAFHHTVRYPDAAGNSQPELSNKQLASNGPNLHVMTYQLIAGQSNYAPFSNTGYSDGRGGLYNSLENMHNAVHALIGNGGHMSNIPYSAFDPIFWLHHANVDRLLAIWQAIYPDSYTTPQVNEVGTFTDAPGSSEGINTPLTPFHSDDAGTLYTSETARYTRTFGYTYPEIIDWNVNSSQLSSNVRTKLNALYNPTGEATKRSSPMKRAKAAAQYPNAANHQWFVNIRVDKSALSSSFFIHFFLGPVPLSPETWSFASSIVASHPVLAPSAPIPAVSPVASYGQISLTHALLSSTISSLDPEGVVPLLAEHLSWRIQAFDDSVVDVEEVESLKVYVVGQEVWQSAGIGDEFPTYGPLIPYRDITSGKSGGLKDGDPL